MSGTRMSRDELREQLRELGVEAVTVEYNGSGDDGQIEDPQFGSVDVSSPLTAAVWEFFYLLLDELYSGWEDNNGAFGQLVWNVGDDKINIVHNTRTESYETEERNL